jgi:hypothetical protein
MRWSRLFADLESQLDALVSAEVAGEVAERTRIELSRVHLVDRLRAAEDHPIEVHCAGAGAIRGQLSSVAAEWLLIAEPSGGEALVANSAVLGVVGLGRAVAPRDDTAVARRLGMRQALRAIAKDRAPVEIHLVDGAVHTGTVDRVGADFLDVAIHLLGESRRTALRSSEVALPVHAIAVVRRC